MQPVDIQLNQQQLAPNFIPINAQAKQLPSQLVKSNEQHPLTVQQSHLPKLNLTNKHSSQYSSYGASTSAYYNRLPSTNYNMPSTSQGTKSDNVSNTGIIQHQQDLFLRPDVPKRQQNVVALNSVSMNPNISYQPEPLALSNAGHSSNAYTQETFQRNFPLVNTQSSQQTMNTRNELQQIVQQKQSTSLNIQQTPFDMQNSEPIDLTQLSSRSTSSSDEATEHDRKLPMAKKENEQI